MLDFGTVLNRSRVTDCSIIKSGNPITFQNPTTPFTKLEIDTTSGQSSANYLQVAGGKNIFHPATGSATIDGITCTVAADGTITLNGTATAGSLFYISNSAFGTMPASSTCIAAMTYGKKYCISLTEISGTNSDPYSTTVGACGTGSTALLFDTTFPHLIEHTTYAQLTAGTKHPYGSSTALAIRYFHIYISSGITLSNYKIKVQMAQENTTSAWEQYKGVKIYKTPQIITNGTYDFISGKGKSASVPSITGTPQQITTYAATTITSDNGIVTAVL